MPLRGLGCCHHIVMNRQASLRSGAGCLSFKGGNVFLVELEVITISEMFQKLFPQLVLRGDCFGNCQLEQGLVADDQMMASAEGTLCSMLENGNRDIRTAFRTSDIDGIAFHTGVLFFFPEAAHSAHLLEQWRIHFALKAVLVFSLFGQALGSQRVEWSVDRGPSRANDGDGKEVLDKGTAGNQHGNLGHQDAEGDLQNRAAGHGETAARHQSVGDDHQLRIRVFRGEKPPADDGCHA